MKIPYSSAPRAVAPKTHGCTCLTGIGLFTCQRYAVLRVGRHHYCAQHAKQRGIALPVTTEGA